ncbi:MAG: 50S ribosomal protein L3 N(5)-glutamine methyltransferase [Halioglobus sp.]
MTVADAIAVMLYTCTMTTKEQAQQIPEHIGDALNYCVTQLEASDVFFGHGTDNAWDESVQLVLGAAEVALDSDDGALQIALLPAQREHIADILSRRIKDRQPLPYLLGYAWFAGLRFRSDARAIVPRSPLAELIHNDFAPWYSGPEPSRVLDLCCGSGCIGIATAHYLDGVEVDLADLDSQALTLAQENVADFGLQNRVSVIHSDLFADVPCAAKYDLILCNPPYVDAGDLASMPAEYGHEPKLALGSGSDGLDLSRRILAQAEQYLNTDGLLVLEVGNSWVALEEAYPRVPFTWLEFANGGHGVLAITRNELKEFSASFAL